MTAGWTAPAATASEMAVSVAVWLFAATNLVCALAAGWRLYRQHQQLAVLRAQVKSQRAQLKILGGQLLLARRRVRPAQVCHCQAPAGQERDAGQVRGLQVVPAEVSA